MPPAGKINLKEKARKLPDRPGVYRMRDRFGAILYIGKAKSLKKRVSSYFMRGTSRHADQPKIAAMLKLVYDFDITEVRSEAEAILLEGRLIKEWKPKYNTDFTDDKRFLLVRVDVQNPMPFFRLVRNRRDDQARYFGPFASAGSLRKTLAEMRTRYGILLGDARPKHLDGERWKLYEDLRAEIYGHANELTEAEYRERVEAACTFLEGKARDWLEEMEEKMQEAAREQAFERAAYYRDRIEAMRDTLSRTRRFTGALREPDREAGVNMLQEVLKLDKPPRIMECFDISHISGTFCVASLVRFSDGRPDKAQYRRYKIKSFVGNDDFRAMEEVVGRRYRRLHEEGRTFPDLVVIDGGVGQVGAALKAFAGAELQPPALIGLAKKNETIIFSDGRDSLNLPAEHAGLRLLQRLRDEAHRFANSFNAELRSQRIRESVLDEFRGLGETRRKALLAHFRSLDRLRKATVQDMQAVPGIGPKLAAELRAFLDRH